MQPAFIRVVDNVRKHLDVSSWTGIYQDVLIWPANTTEETQGLVNQLLLEIETATPDRGLEIKAVLSQLPIPHPGYHLLLQRQEQRASIDLWELCYEVCFLNYSSQNSLVTVDMGLIDEFGEVDWQNLENKTKELVKRVFEGLPED